MTRQKAVHYSRAPIAEAVIDLQVSFGESPPDLVRLEVLARSLKAEFPQQQRINSVQMAIRADGNDEATTSYSTSGIGFRLTNATGDRVAQLRLNGLSFSHLQPYSDWEVFSSEVRPLWEKFENEFQPKLINRLAVRYINRIEVPQGVELDEYLNYAPKLPDGFGPVVEGYFLNVVMPQTDLGNEFKAIVNTGLEWAGSPNSMTVLLDIDMFVTGKFSSSNESLWMTLGLLRDRKNKIFEAAITDKVRRMIE